MITRSLTVAADGEHLSFSGRLRLRGRDELSLFPALFTLDLWNLPEDEYLRLFRCRNISVSCGEACLVSGMVSDVYRRAMADSVLTSVSISLGLDLWEAMVSLTVPAGTTASETVRQILTASGTGISLLTNLENDSIIARSQSFFGRAAECIETVLSAVSARAMLTPSGLMIVSATSIGATPHRGDRLFRLTSAPTRFPPLAVAGASPCCRSPEPVQIHDTDLLDAPSFADGGRLAVLSCSVAGWRPGQTAEVSRKGTSFRGIIRSRSVDADTGSGPWKCELLCEVLK